MSWANRGSLGKGKIGSIQKKGTIFTITNNSLLSIIIKKLEEKE